jgi:molybdopterin-guanine dinucleotide biosynthesis protein A
VYTGGVTYGAIVLAGGLSRRMGRAKALLPWRGRTMIEHVVGVLRQAVEDVVVVTSAELDLPALEARIVRDREPRLGPLGGIREGLEASRAGLCYATSTDAPFLTPAFVRAVLSYGGAAAPDVDGFVQSMAAAYPRALAPVAAQLITEGRMRPLFLLEAGGFRRIAASELPDIESLQNLNTSDDYLAALRRDGAHMSATVELFGVARTKAGVASFDVPAGRLGDVLRAVEERTGLKLEGAYLASLNGRQFVREPSVPVGPAERVLVMDAAAGG